MMIDINKLIKLFIHMPHVTHVHTEEELDQPGQTLPPTMTVYLSLRKQESFERGGRL